MDERVRLAERYAAEIDTDEARANVLREQLRAGILSQQQLDLLIWAGYHPAWIVQDYWIHSDHIPAICPCPSCWKGGADVDWALEIHKRWGEEITQIALAAALAVFPYSLLHSSHNHRKLWRIIFDEDGLHRKFRAVIETALIQYVLKHEESPLDWYNRNRERLLADYHDHYVAIDIDKEEVVVACIDEASFEKELEKITPYKAGRRLFVTFLA